MIDPFEDVSTPDEADLGELAKQVVRHGELTDQVNELEAQLKVLGKELKRLEEEVIPDLLSAAGTQEFTTNSGLKVKLEQKVYASLPKDDLKRTAALTAVREAGGESIIKNTLTAQFGKGEGQRAIAAQQALSAIDVAALLKEDIHHSTYAAWINERMKNGDPVDLDALGAYLRRFAKIERK